MMTLIKNLHRKLIWTSILASLAIVSLSSAEEEETVTNKPLFLEVGDVIRMVQEENLQVLVNREAIEEAVQIFRQRKADLYPQINLDFQQTRNQFVNTGRGFDIPGIDPVQPPANRFDGLLVGNMSVLSTERIANWKLAKLGVEVSELAFQDILQDILEVSIGSFITHRRNLVRMDLIEADIERNQSLLDLAADRFEAGVATQIDVTRAEVALADSEQARLQQETIILSSELQLKQLLNLPLDQPIEVEVSDEQMSAAPPPMMVTEDALLENRSDYQAELKVQEQNELARRAAGLQRIPQIDIFGQWGYATNVVLDGDGEQTWGVGISMSIPIFEGFRIGADKRQAESRIRSQSYVLQNLAKEIGSAYRLQVKDVISRYEQIGVARKTRDLGFQELDLAETRFRQGVANNLEVVNAQNSLAASEDNLLEAFYQYALARIALARAMGDVASVENY